MPIRRLFASIAPLLAMTILVAAEPVQLSGIVHDAGAAYPGQIVTHRFVVRNPEEKPWRIIELKPSCSCAVSQPASLDIPAGGMVEVPIAFPVGEKVDRPVVALITALVQRPGDIAAIPLRLEAVVRSPIVAPSRVVLESGQSSIEVKVSKGGHPTPWTTLRARIASGGEVLTISEPTAQGDGWIFTITSNPGRWSGTLLGRVELSCLADGKPLPYVPAITVVTRIAGRLRCAPAALLFGSLVPEEPLALQAQVRATSGGLAGAVVTTSDARFAATLDPASGLLTVEFRPAPPTGPANAWAEIAIGEDRLRVPLIAGVAERPKAPSPGK